jgi:hypothetical protein
MSAVPEHEKAIPPGASEKEIAPTGTKAAPVEDDDEDEDIDALIEDLESQDGNEIGEEETVEPGGARIVPEDLLQTDTRHGLTSAEVLNRRKKYGMNQMKEEKENLILKFLGFFVGPIQFVMEVSFPLEKATRANNSGCCCPCCWSSGLGRFRCHLRLVAAQRLCRFHPGIPGWFHCRGVEEDSCSQGHRSP